MTRFGSLVNRVDERGRGVELPLMSVSQTRGIIRRTELTPDLPRADSLDEYKICRRGDIVFNKMSIRDGAMGVAGEDGLVTYHYEVMRPRRGVDPRYVVYMMKSDWFRGELIRLERGIGTGGTAGVRTTEVPFSVLRTIDADIASPSVQRSIAEYLDRETARIDKILDKRRREAGLLDERLHSSRDLRIRALADRYGTVPLKRMSVGIEQGWSPECEAVPASGDEPGVLKTSAVSRGVFDPEENKRLPAGVRFDARLVVRTGDVLVVRGSGSPEAVGQAAVAQTDGRRLLLADLLYRIRPYNCVPEFIVFALQSRFARDQLESSIRTDVGMTRKIRSEDLASVLVPAATIAEQQDAAAAIGRESRAIRTAREAALRQIDLLLERRQALITAAVTGQLEIPGVAA